MTLFRLLPFLCHPEWSVLCGAKDLASKAGNKKGVEAGFFVGERRLLRMTLFPLLLFCCHPEWSVLCGAKDLAPKDLSNGW